jgi:nicotinate-nucleotide adenylyltransferase
MRVGILGGTFDPIHLGHLDAAQAARRCASLDQVLLVPAGKPPHKRGTRASAADRLEMCRLAADQLPGIGVWDWEVRRTEPSYTVDTLRAFRRQRPEDTPFLVLGWDAAQQIPTWQQPAEIVRLAKMVLFERPGLPPPGEADLRAAGLDPARVTVCAEPTRDVAATRIRRLAGSGRSLAGLVPPEVERYIAERGLYRSRPRA